MAVPKYENGTLPPDAITTVVPPSVVVNNENPSAQTRLRMFSGRPLLERNSDRLSYWEISYKKRYALSEWYDSILLTCFHSYGKRYPHEIATQLIVRISRRWTWTNPDLKFFSFPYRIHQKQVSWGSESVHCLSFFCDRWNDRAGQKLTKVEIGLRKAQLFWAVR